MPATINPIVDEKLLPKKPTAGVDELWLIQIPGDVDISDLSGLRFKLTGEGSGADMASLKAAGAPGIIFITRRQQLYGARSQKKIESTRA